MQALAGVDVMMKLRLMCGRDGVRVLVVGVVVVSRVLVPVAPGRASSELLRRSRPRWSWLGNLGAWWNMCCRVKSMTR